MIDLHRMHDNVQLKVHWLFEYVPDSVQFDRPEDWRSHADAVENGESFKGDCDDFAMTCAELLVREGADKSDVGIAYCKTEEDVYHLACLYKGYVLDNRHEWPWPWDRVGYEWISVMYMDDPGDWLKFAENE